MPQYIKVAHYSHMLNYESPRQILGPKEKAANSSCNCQLWPKVEKRRASNGGVKKQGE